MAPDQKPALSQVLRAIIREILSDHVLMVAAGLTFYAVLGLLPGLAVAAAIWGQFGDLGLLRQSVESGGQLFPAGARHTLEQFVTSIPEGFGGGLGLVLNIVLAVTTCYRAASGLLTALNIVYDVAETRGWLRRACVALVIGIGGILLLFAALVLVTVPALLAQRNLPAGHALLWLRWPALALAFTGGLALLFRYAVSRDPDQWWSVLFGAVLAALLWLGASFGVTVYARFAGSFGRLYGSFGAIVVVLLWFYASALSVLAGAEVDATLAERAGGRQRGGLRSALRRHERAGWD